MRTPLLLYGLALVVRGLLILQFPDPAYPDSAYYVDVARQLHAFHGFNVDFVWIFAEVGGIIPAHPVLPIPAFGHWMPLASLVQLPFLFIFGDVPWTWAFILLTKVTPGVGLAWFAVRREWRSLAIALGVTAAIAAVSLAVDGHLWVDWLGFLGRAGGGATVAQFDIGIPLWIRLPAALVLVAWGGLTDRRWTVPVAATLGLPILWPSGFAICAALAHRELWAGRAR